VLESLVVHRLIDRSSEWHLHRHRYEHNAREIYLAKTMRWHPQSSCIVVWTYSWIVKLPFSTVSKAGGRTTRHIRHQVVMSEGHEENEGSVNECDAHSSKTKAE
jgi:hypothetical protein